MKRFLSLAISIFILLSCTFLCVACNRDNEERVCSHNLVLESVGDNQHRYKCSKCDYKTEITNCSFCGEYTSLDGHKHQKLCLCGNVILEEDHDLKLMHDGNGMHWYECVCGIASQKSACTCGETGGTGETPRIRPD